MITTYLFTTAISVVAVRTAFEQWRSRALSRRNWDDVVAELQATPTIEITAIALEYLNPRQSSVMTDSTQRLASLGGLEGLKRMRKNGDLLIALAAQAERWDPRTTRSLVAQMRRDGAELRRNSFWLSIYRLNDQDEKGRARLQRAAAAYYSMAYRLLDAAREYSPNYLKSLNTAIWN